MADYDEVFPVCIGFGSTETIRYDADIFRAASGKSVTTSYWSEHLRQWDVLTGIRDQGDFEQFLDFYHAFNGPEDTFRFKSPLDNSSATPGSAITITDQTIEAAATAGQATVQVIKTRSAGSATTSYSIYELDTSTLLVEVNGSPVTLGVDFTESDGLLTFSPTLSLNDVVKDGYDYYLRAQFGAAQFSVTLPTKTSTEFFLRGSIPILQVRP